MRLIELSRSTSFRLALLFLGLFGGASLVLFAVLYWQTVGYLKYSVDSSLNRESVSYGSASPASLRQRLNIHAARDPDGDRPYTLFDRNNAWVAGMPLRMPVHRIYGEPFQFPVMQEGDTVQFRGLLTRLPSGDSLLVGQDVQQMLQFRRLLVNALVSGGLLVLTIGLAGATLIGAGTIRKINSVTGAIERIVKGQLSERLPTHGQAGDLDRLIAVVNGMLDDIERLMLQVKNVSNDIAHDLRTPLTRLMAGLERTQRRASSCEDFASAIDAAILETKSILEMFATILRIAEIEDGARRREFKAIDLNAVAADVAEFYGPLAEEKAVSLQLECDPQARAELLGDSGLLFEALANLVDNAIKFTPPSSSVSIRVTASAEGAGIAVVDQGPGIPFEERDAVLRRLYRGEKSRHTQGSGLGLSLVAAIAHLHGLKLRIEDAAPGCRVSLLGDPVQAPA